jgi:hypothetical protein
MPKKNPEKGIILKITGMKTINYVKNDTRINSVLGRSFRCLFTGVFDLFIR